MPVSIHYSKGALRAFLNRLALSGCGNEHIARELVRLRVAPPEGRKWIPGTALLYLDKLGIGHDYTLTRRMMAERAIKLALQGVSYAEVARQLSKRGFLNKAGGQLSGHNVRHLIKLYQTGKLVDSD